MPWIARDSTDSNPYRIFGVKPLKLQMIDREGDPIPGQYTWSRLESSGREMRGGYDGRTYAPYSNEEATELPAADSPVELEPGEGPVEVGLVLAGEAKERPWEGEGI